MLVFSGFRAGEVCSKKVKGMVSNLKEFTYNLPGGIKTNTSEIVN